MSDLPYPWKCFLQECETGYRIRFVGVTVEAAIEQAQEREHLNQSPCLKCGRSLRTKMLKVGEWPSVLVLHLKRWFRGAAGARWRKKAGLIAFEPELHRGGKAYTLRAVVVHIGNASKGHYICYRSFGSHWYKCDDRQVTRCVWEDVLRAEAYILFYEA